VINAAVAGMIVSISLQRVIFSLVTICSVFRLVYVLRGDKSLKEVVQGFLHLSKFTWAFNNN